MSMAKINFKPISITMENQFQKLMAISKRNYILLYVFSIIIHLTFLMFNYFLVEYTIEILIFLRL